MDALMQLGGHIPLSTIILVISAIVFLFTIGKKIYNLITTFHDNMQAREEEIKTIEKQLDEIKLQQKVSQDRILDLSKKQSELVLQVNANEKSIRKRDLNKLRNQLIKGHKYYTNENINPLKAWSELESNAFYALYDDYKELGGNGYIDNNIKPEMDELDIIPMDDAPSLKLLQDSRKGEV